MCFLVKQIFFCPEPRFLSKASQKMVPFIEVRKQLREGMCGDRQGGLVLGESWRSSFAGGDGIRNLFWPHEVRSTHQSCLSIVPVSHARRAPVGVDRFEFGFEISWNLPEQGKGWPLPPWVQGTALPLPPWVQGTPLDGGGRSEDQRKLQATSRPCFEGWALA